MIRAWGDSVIDYLLDLFVLDYFTYLRDSVRVNKEIWNVDWTVRNLTEETKQTIWVSVVFILDCSCNRSVILGYGEKIETATRRLRVIVTLRIIIEEERTQRSNLIDIFGGLDEILNEQTCLVMFEFFIAVLHHFIVYFHSWTKHLLRLSHGEVKCVLVQAWCSVDSPFLLLGEDAISTNCVADSCVAPHGFFSDLFHLFIISWVIPVELHGQADPPLSSSVPKLADKQQVWSLVSQIGFNLFLLSHGIVWRKEALLYFALGTSQNVLN